MWTVAFEEGNSAHDDLIVLVEFNAEGEASDQEVEDQYTQVLKLVEDLEFKNMLSGEEDNMNAVLQINSGAGGTESQDWADMLLRMYAMWGEKGGFKITTLDHQPGDGAGVKRRVC